MLVAITQFKGEIKAIAPRLLKSGYAQVATATKLENGNLQAYKSLLTVTASLLGSLMKSLYFYRNASWFQWSDDIDIVKAPLSGDTADRVIYTGESEPRITDAAIGTGVGLMPAAYYNLGVPAPQNAPTNNLGGTAGENPTTEYRSYVYTYVNSYDQEGPPSPPSDTITWQTGQTMGLTNLSTGPDGAYNITRKRIYRVNSGETSAEFQYVGEILVGVATFTDAVLSENLAEVLATSSYDPPPAGLKGLIELPNGGTAGFLNNDIFFSEPYACHAWPYIYSTHDAIVGLGAYGNSVLVLTTGTPYVLTGDHPSAMSMERLEVSYPCSSKRGIVDLGYAIAFPSPEGLIVIGLDVARNVTAPDSKGSVGLMTAAQWQALAPSSILGVLWQGKYVGFYDAGGVKGGFIIDPAKDTMVMLSTFATAAWVNPITGNLYLAVGAVGSQSIVQWDAGASFLPYVWESGAIVVPSPTNFAAAQVLAESYPLTFTLRCSAANQEDAMYAVMGNPLLAYENPGTIVYTVTVNNGQPFRLPGGYAGREFSVEISSSAGVVVTSAFLCNAISELAQV